MAASREELGHIELYAGDAPLPNGLPAELRLGRFDEAELYAGIAVRIAAEDDLASQSVGRSARALVLAAQGDFTEAERLAREAVELYSKAEAPNFQGDVWLDLAKVLRMSGKPEEAERAAHEALTLYERKGNRPSTVSTRAFIEELGASA